MGHILIIDSLRLLRTNIEGTIHEMLFLGLVYINSLEIRKFFHESLKPLKYR